MKKLLVILMLLIALPSYAKHEHTFVSIISCSESFKQEVFFIQNSLELQGYSVPLVITCNAEATEKDYKASNLPYKFSDINGLYISNQSDVFDYIYLRETPVNMSISRALTHELGHYNHKLKIGATKFSQLSHSPVPEELKPLITKKMRAYATVSKAEYVAEYFSFSQMGYTFPKELKDLYKECGGP